MTAASQKKSSGVWVILLITVVVLLLGLMVYAVLAMDRSQEILTYYGSAQALAGGDKSVNGTGVFAELIRQAGHNVNSSSKLTPSIRNRSDVIIWFQNDFSPPSDEARDWLEAWLLEDYDRTLIYVGRDFDAASAYWEDVAPQAPANIKTEVGVRAQADRSRFTSQRASLPSQDEDWGWFTFNGALLPGPGGKPSRRRPKTLSGEADLIADVDPAKIDIQFYGQLKVDPEQYDVLVSAGGEDLIAWRDVDGSQVFVVSNGSFLLNYPLVNHEHRKLAARLVEELGPPPQNVTFLESGGNVRISERDAQLNLPTAFDFLDVQPLGYMILQLVLVGLLWGFSRWPIFGLPREEQRPTTSDFGQHIQSLGDLLARTGDEDYARNRLEHYEQQVKQHQTKSEKSRNHP